MSDFRKIESAVQVCNVAQSSVLPFLEEMMRLRQEKRKREAERVKEPHEEKCAAVV
jgi:hypothetical protein